MAENGKPFGNEVASLAHHYGVVTESDDEPRRFKMPDDLILQLAEWATYHTLVQFHAFAESIRRVEQYTIKFLTIIVTQEVQCIEVKISGHLRVEVVAYFINRKFSQSGKQVQYAPFTNSFHPFTDWPHRKRIAVQRATNMFKVPDHNRTPFVFR
ncbi:hypothetical protein BC343_27160 [Mucilaginibacter pedocola]|uniref:Uncharacterized protein n=1 Tax=Mucilaginibacter pedocola TaxID=1792845 RepID=A0A1S9PGC7_9SPHI|nr:hypothetical protein BC343_27160 [Mucilaginibacter pedocola]